jgi:glyoxylase-like metal-dependent hydrolase (beta-lactamase superfamily II)
VSQQKLKKALTGISTTPIKYLINTHWHFDHTEGNEWVHKAGATILAHENTRRNLSKTIRVVDWNYTFTPSPKSAIPTLVFKDDHVLEFNKSKIKMKYYGHSAHTDSDVSIFFPDADVLSVGDTWWNPLYPFIDHSSGGSLAGMIDACNQNLAIISKNTLIVPGHGSIGNRGQLIEFRDMLVSIKERIAKLKNAGRSLAETIAAKPTASYDSKFGGFLDAAFFTRLVYTDV